MVNMSMVSSSMGMGHENFGHFDSMGGVDMNQIKETIRARETKIKSLIEDKKKLKGLLVKAKTAISKMDSSCKATVEQLRLTQSKLQHSNIEKDTL